jgi:hypothetical protein
LGKLNCAAKKTSVITPTARKKAFIICMAIALSSFGRRAGFSLIIITHWKLDWWRASLDGQCEGDVTPFENFTIERAASGRLSEFIRKLFYLSELHNITQAFETKKL